MSNRVKYSAAGRVVVLVALGAAGFLYRKHQGRDIRGSSSVEFVQTEPKAAKERVGVTWPMYGYDAARLRAPLGFKVHPPFRRAPVWTFRAHALLEFPPAVAYSRIYIVNNAGTVFALHQQSGKALWKYHTHRCSPALAEGIVIVGCWSHDVYAFTAASGNLRWHFKAGGLVKGAISQSGNRVYFGAYDTHVYALDLHTGKQIWRASSQPRIGRTGTFYANAASAYGRVYIGATDGEMFSLRATTG